MTVEQTVYQLFADHEARSRFAHLSAGKWTPNIAKSSAALVMAFAAARTYAAQAGKVSDERILDALGRASKNELGVVSSDLFDSLAHFGWIVTEFFDGPEEAAKLTGNVFSELSPEVRALDTERVRAAATFILGYIKQHRDG